VLLFYRGADITGISKHPESCVLLIDRLLPDMDGIDVCRHLRRNELTKNSHVIIMSTSAKGRLEAAKADADDFLEMPFNMHELLALVRKNAHGEKPTAL
jgi:two-component system sensor histidine kinase ChiS